MPGKFEGNADEALAERLYNITLEGRADDEIGIEEMGWYGLILGFEGKSYIVEEDNYGFFTYTEYDTLSAAQAAWNDNVIQSFEEFYGEAEPMQEGAVVKDVGPGVPAIIGEAGPEAVIPLDDPAAVETMAEAIKEGGAGANANDASIAAAEAIESAAEAIESAAEAVEAVAEAHAVEEVAEAAAEVAEAEADAVEEVAEAAEEAIEHEADRAPEVAHAFFRKWGAA